MTYLRRTFSVVLAALLPVITGCAGKQNMSAHGPAAANAAGKSNSIGVAWLEKDGTLVLQLRADGAGGTVGDGMFRYKPNEKDYAVMIEHIGGLKVGETKPVPPWSAGESGKP